MKENEDALAHGTVHLKSTSDNDRDYIVQNEQSIDFTEEQTAGIGSSDVGK